jgi:predicted O-methyltransferase YrrM
MRKPSQRLSPAATRWCVLDADNQWFAPPVAGASTVGRKALHFETIGRAAQILDHVPDDAYRRFLSKFYRQGLERCGASWQYADINTVLIAAAMLVQPESYLEIGVRTGRSIAMVSCTAPHCAVVGFDLWIPEYAGMANPGPDVVTTFLRDAGHMGPLEFVTGDSKVTVPAYLEAHPDAFFDIVTVDGDHTRGGARADLLQVIDRVKIGGVLVFDDVANPAHSWLIDVWREVVESDRRYSSWIFDEIGFGVACAVRHR